jgi:hypothetical protein
MRKYTGRFDDRPAWTLLAQEIEMMMNLDPTGRPISRGGCRSAAAARG